MTQEQISSGLITLLGDELAGFGVTFSDPEVVVDEDSEWAAFVSLTFDPYETDDGLVTPDPITMEFRYNKADDEYIMILGEDYEMDIAQGSLFSCAYFYSQQAAHARYAGGGSEPLRYTGDGELAECPKCRSLDVGGVGGSCSTQKGIAIINCYSCGIELRKEGTLKEACQHWNKRAPVGYAGIGEAVAALVREIGEDTWFDHAPVKPCGEKFDAIQKSPEMDYCLVYTRPASAVPDKDKLLALIEEYWDIAWQQGFENRHHDDEKGSAQNKLCEIQSMLAASKEGNNP